VERLGIKILSCLGKRSRCASVALHPICTYGASDDQNELDDLVGFRTFGAQISVENLKDNLTENLCALARVLLPKSFPKSSVHIRIIRG